MVRAFTLAALLLASACSPIVSVRGHNETTRDFSQIIVGQSRPEDVQAILGSPSSRSDFGDQTWYYITTTEETRGMFAPAITAQQVTSVRFDASQLVAEISQYEMKDGKPVALVKRETPTEGHELTFIEQLLGNVGRINSPGGGSGIGQAGRAGRR